MGNLWSRRHKKHKRSVKQPQFVRKNYFNKFLNVRDIVSEDSSTTSESSSSSEIFESENSVNYNIESNIKNSKLLLVLDKSSRKCISLRNILTGYEINEESVNVRNIDGDPDRNQILVYLRKQTGSSAPPYIFINGNCIEYDRVVSLHKEKLLHRFLLKEHILTRAGTLELENVSTQEELSLDSRFSDSSNMSYNTSDESDSTLISSTIRSNASTRIQQPFIKSLPNKETCIKNKIPPIPPPQPNALQRTFSTPVQKLQNRKSQLPIVIQRNSNREYVQELKEALQSKYGNSPNLRQMQYKPDNLP